MATTYHLSIPMENVEAPAFRFTARFPSGALLALDSRSGPAAPTPVDLILAAVGACGGMDVIGILRKKRQQVTGYEVRVEAERRDEHPRIFTHIEVIHRLRGRDLQPQAIEEAIRLSDTRYCSIHAMLEGVVKLSSRWEILPEAENSLPPAS